MKKKHELTSRILLALLIGIHLIRSYINLESFNLDQIAEFPHSPYIDPLAGLLAFWSYGAIEYGHLWRMLTGAFLHGDFIHLAVNCWALWQFLPWIVHMYEEKSAQLILWLSVLGGSALSLLVALYEGLNPKLYGVGISGGLFGLVAVYIVTLRFMHKLSPNPGTKSALNSIYFFMALNLYLGFTIPNINNAGHFGGFITGWLLGKYLIKKAI